jgi:hypothetical protein
MLRDNDEYRRETLLPSMQRHVLAATAPDLLREEH